MSISKKDKYQLNLHPNQKNDWVNISVFDANNNLMSKQTGTFTDALPKGLYTVVSELSGVTTQTIIKHVSANSVAVDTPIIKGFDKKIAYAEIAKEQSRKNEMTFDNPMLGGINNSTPKLFVFCHATHKEQYNQVKKLYKDLKIYDEWNKKVLKMEEEDWVINEAQGWMAFQTYLPAGMYFFNYRKNLKNRSFSITLADEFQTQIILPFHKQPDFNAIQIGIGKDSFYSYGGADAYRSFQIAEAKMLNGDYNLPQNVMRELAYGKWMNPIYGMMVCYIYLLNEKHEQDDLITTIIENLEYRILNTSDNPDLKILKLLLSVHLGNQNFKPEIEPILKVPMFKIGVTKLIELSYTYPDLIEEDGIIDLIAGRLQYNNIWTCFKPTRIKYDFTVKRADTPKKRGLFASIKKKFDNTKRNIENISDLLDDFLPAIMELKARNQEIDPLQLARMIGIPYVTLKRKVTELDALFKQNDGITDFTVAYLSKLFDKDYNEEVVKIITDLSQQIKDQKRL